MAYAALMTLSKAIDLLLPHHEEYTFLCDQEQMQFLKAKLIQLQQFLEHVSRRPSSRTSLEVMEGRITKTAYQVEDIVESILIGSFRQNKSFYQALASKCVPCCLTEEASGDTLADRTIATFASCIGEVDVLLKDSTEMKKSINTNVIYRTIFSSTEKSSSSEPPTFVDTNIGLEEDFDQILYQITNGVPSLRIIPITGMGGIGKTTLARGVYDHQSLQHHFDIRMWVTVSQEWSIQDILQGLLHEEKAKNVDVSSLILRIHQRLFGRRYLIVLDDVWHEDVWDQVKRAFPDRNNRSRIILTTRLLKLGQYVTGPSSQLHQMKFLSDEQSWNLLREKVYGGNEHCHVEFENIGRVISRNCKGLPLAVIVIGGLLKFKKTKDYWEEVAKMTTVEASVGDEYLLEILSLSYTNLPPHLKACFLYFGMFREDKEIITEELVRLWSAEGFLKPRESKTVEEVAEECLEELVERSLVLVKNRRYNGKIERSSIHDVLRDFSLRESRKENFLHYSTTGDIDPFTYEEIIKEQRRVSFMNSQQHQPKLYTTKNDAPVRSLIYEGKEKVPVTSFNHLKLLRVLRLSGGMLTLNDPINNLFSRMTNLRYLELLSMDGKQLRIPRTISKLKNLETLLIVVFDTFKSITLPLEIWNMPRLRHLIFPGALKISFPEPSLINGSSSLESLQTLYGVMDLRFTMNVINKMLNLRRLHAYYERKDANQCGLDNLVHLHNLQCLHLGHFSSGNLLTNFVFPQKLKELYLFETKIPWEKMVSIGELPHLEWLNLHDDSFVGEVWEPSEGGFSQLKYLSMDRLDLEEWRAVSTHFPSLEELKIGNCRKLKEVPIEIGEIDTLKKLTIRGEIDTLKESLEESVKKIQEEIELNGNDSLQVILKQSRWD